jgi:hypothetical protein
LALSHLGARPMQMDIPEAEQAIEKIAAFVDF